MQKGAVRSLGNGQVRMKSAACTVLLLDVTLTEGQREAGLGGEEPAEEEVVVSDI